VRLEGSGKLKEFSNPQPPDVYSVQQHFPNATILTFTQISIMFESTIAFLKILENQATTLNTLLFLGRAGWKGLRPTLGGIVG
jgi:hypothetical protein